jgi:hypothetical protein
LIDFKKDCNERYSALVLQKWPAWLSRRATGDLSQSPRRAQDQPLARHGPTAAKKAQQAAQSAAFITTYDLP